MVAIVTAMGVGAQSGGGGGGSEGLPLQKGGSYPKKVKHLYLRFYLKKCHLRNASSTRV